MSLSVICPSSLANVVSDEHLHTCQGNAVIFKGVVCHPQTQLMDCWPEVGSVERDVERDSLLGLDLKHLRKPHDSDISSPFCTRQLFSALGGEFRTHTHQAVDEGTI